jgi:NAD-dependent dihydropyrimidine dehydrogenase PreA subunit
MKHRYLSNSATLKLDPAKCSGCGMCTKVCPHNVLKVISGKAVIVDKDACMECGACSRNCPSLALSVNPGVGCAAAIIRGFLTGSEPTCGCSGGDNECSDSNSSCC